MKCIFKVQEPPEDVYKNYKNFKKYMVHKLTQRYPYLSKRQLQAKAKLIWDERKLKNKNFKAKTEGKSFQNLSEHDVTSDKSEQSSEEAQQPSKITVDQSLKTKEAQQPSKITVDQCIETKEAQQPSKSTVDQSSQDQQCNENRVKQSNEEVIYKSNDNTLEQFSEEASQKVPDNSVLNELDTSNQSSSKPENYLIYKTRADEQQNIDLFNLSGFESNSNLSLGSTSRDFLIHKLCNKENISPRKIGHCKSTLRQAEKKALTSDRNLQESGFLTDMFQDCGKVKVKPFSSGRNLKYNSSNSGSFRSFMHGEETDDDLFSC